jgi:hypothetical protein
MGQKIESTDFAESVSLPPRRGALALQVRAACPTALDEKKRVERPLLWG